MTHICKAHLRTCLYKSTKLFIHFTRYQRDDTSVGILHGLHKENEISEEGSKSMLSTVKKDKVLSGLEWYVAIRMQQDASLDEK